jgi:hypothetical protein
MNIKDIEYLWKRASNNPHHDTNWHDPVVINFAKLVVAHTLSIIDPSKFMSYQEGMEAGRLAEREACAKVCDNRVTAYQYATDVWAQEHIDEARHLAKAIRARGQA